MRPANRADDRAGLEAAALLAVAHEGAERIAHRSEVRDACLDFRQPVGGSGARLQVVDAVVELHQRGDVLQSSSENPRACARLMKRTRSTNAPG